MRNSDSVKVSVIIAAPKLLAMLKSIEFLPFNDFKCPVCYGWDGRPNARGETPRYHNPMCELAAVLKEAEG